MKKKITWITADYFIDVDLPILPILSDSFDIEWIVVLDKLGSIDYKSLIKSKLEYTKVNVQYFYQTKRIRNPLLIKEYIDLVLLLKKDKPDIYYFDISGLPYLFPLVNLFLNKKKIIIATHNVTTPVGAVNYSLAKYYMNYIIRKFNNLHVFSKEQKNVLERISKHKNILLAPLALKDFGQIEKRGRNKSDKIVFLFFGYIRDYKRLDILMKAGNTLYGQVGNVFKIIIAGNCISFGKYKELIQFSELFDLRIESIPNEEVPNLFAQSHYTVFPYQDIAQSGSVTVAFNYNIPIIVSDLPAFQSLVVDKETGFIFKSQDVDSLVDVMKYIVENHKQIYPVLKEKQKSFVTANYAIEFISEKYKSYFNSIIG